MWKVHFGKGKQNNLVQFFSLAFPLVLARWMACSDFFFLSPSPPFDCQHFAEVAHSNLQNSFIEKVTNVCCSILLLFGDVSCL